MFILIPLGGIGTRFRKKGFDKPKALIEVEGKPILFHLLDNLHITPDIDFIYVPYNQEYVSYQLETLLVQRYPSIPFRFLPLNEETRGAAETIYIALNKIDDHDKPVLCIDSDNFYTMDLIKEWKGQNVVCTIQDKTPDPKFSYIQTDEHQMITDIIEKVKISDKACSGCYGFSSFKTLQQYCLYIMDHQITQKGEYYTSGVIKEMLNDKIMFKNLHIPNKHYFCLGTPEQCSYYSHAFLLDLDGTLVKTDRIYLQVWERLLQEYQIQCNEDFFHSFIKGKSDAGFLGYLIPDITNEKIIQISNAKDELFIQYLHEYTDDIIYNGVYDFLERIKNSRIAIVTSCNRTSAEYLLHKTGLHEFVNVLITADDVTKHKPSPEPYIKAMELLGVNNDQCIILEDSISGYTSAMNANPLQLCVYDNGDNDLSEFHGIIFNDYNTLHIYDMLLGNSILYNEYISDIQECLSNLPIKKITINNERELKTGYICDINLYQITYFDNQKENIILKIENTDNELSKIATKLDMYQKEVYFYKYLSGIMKPIHIPKFYGDFTHKNRHGILLEDLCKYPGCFNMNLNKNIDIALCVVHDIFQMHNRFYFEKQDQVIDIIKPLQKVKEITYYHELIKKRFSTFIKKTQYIIHNRHRDILHRIYENYESILQKASTFPLNMCHGDLKSPNIFYKDYTTPYFLDWQYIHLNKGVSDIVFLLVESIEFDANIVDIIVKYYYQLCKEKHHIEYSEYMHDFKNALCIFPFFVMVWFNSEPSDTLLDNTFPIKFMKNTLKYYEYYLMDK